MREFSNIGVKASDIGRYKLYLAVTGCPGMGRLAGHGVLWSGVVAGCGGTVGGVVVGAVAHGMAVRLGGYGFDQPLLVVYVSMDSGYSYRPVYGLRRLGTVTGSEALEKSGTDRKGVWFGAVAHLP